MNLPVRPFIQPLPTPATPLCPHYGVCGGCATQHLPLAEQRRLKAEHLAELFADSHTAPIPVLASPDRWYYRNKAEFRIDRKQYETPPPPDFPRETVLGFRRKGKWFWTFDVEECRIVSPVAGTVLAAVRAWYRERGVRYHDSRTGTGVLQHLVFREAKRSGERLLILITGPGEHDLSGFVDAVLAAAPVTAILHGVNRGNPDVALAEPEDLHLLHGVAALHEEMWIPDTVAGARELAPGDDADDMDDPAVPVRRLRFRISPFGFFQVNVRATERLYAHLRSIVAATAPRPRVLYDLYGGAGGIALTCSDLVSDVISVESFAPAGDDGRHNCAINGVDNVTFITRRVEGWLGDVIRTGEWAADSLAIIDPARSGLAPKALRRLARLAPPTLVYVSCNPKLLARELPVFLAAGYDVQDLRAFDLFPHTPHVEAVAWLRLDPVRHAAWRVVQDVIDAEEEAAEAAKDAAKDAARLARRAAAAEAAAAANTAGAEAKSTPGT